jgi:hypothetical protein
MSSNSIQIDGDFYVIECPYCADYIQIHKREINCSIFIHGVYIQTGEQVNPHLDKQVCDKLVTDKQIYGCGNQFRFHPTTGLTCLTIKK